MIFSFLFIYIFVVNIVYYVVHIVCEVDVIANSLVLYLSFCSTLKKKFFFFFSDGSRQGSYNLLIEKTLLSVTHTILSVTFPYFMCTPP